MVSAVLAGVSVLNLNLYSNLFSFIYCLCCFFFSSFSLLTFTAPPPSFFPLLPLSLLSNVLLPSLSPFSPSHLPPYPSFTCSLFSHSPPLPPPSLSPTPSSPLPLPSFAVFLSLRVLPSRFPLTAIPTWMMEFLKRTLFDTLLHYLCSQTHFLSCCCSTAQVIT